MLEFREAMADGPNEYDFIAQLSHQFSSHIAKLRLISQLMAEEYPLAEPTQQQIHDTLSALTEQLLYDRRILTLLDGTADPDERLDCKPVSMVALSEEVIATFNPHLLSRPLTLKHPPPPLSVWGDAGHLRVILDNLIGNALKYSEPPQSIIVALEPTWNGGDHQSGYLRTSVTNYGSFIPPAAQEKIFDKFYRYANGSQPGFGLGLYLCRHLVELQGGRLGVESCPVAGTTFWFTLPLAEAALT